MERAAARKILVFVCFILIGLVSPAEAKRVALVIGNSAYEHASRLENPKNDADALAAVLERLDFEVVKGIDLKQREFEKTVRKFARTVRGADVALLFYAGHGLQVNGRNYLAPVDAKLSDEADLDFETLPLRTILKQMEREAKTNLVFLDACRDNPLARNLARSMGTRSAGVGRGLARVDSGVGTLIAFATEPGNVALDGEGNNSPFTSALLKHIETPGVDVDIMLRRVRKEVLERTAGRQVPWSNSSLTGRFEFAGKLEITVENKTPKDDKRITELQDELKKLKDQLKNRPLPQQKPKDDQRVTALQKELAELREELKKRPSSKPKAADDGKMDAMRKELAALKKKLEAKDKNDQHAAGDSTDTEFRTDLSKDTANIHECDRLAASPVNPESVAKGVWSANVKPSLAIPACEAAVREHPDVKRFQVQLARSLQAGRRYDEALVITRQLADAGDTMGYNMLGYFYVNGFGVEKNDAEAVKWFRKAADKGLPLGMYNMGAVYRSGNGVPLDNTKAVQWYQKAANLGSLLSDYALGVMYEKGIGVTKDHAEAMKRYRKAAEGGVPRAMYQLGSKYEEGKLIKQDYAEALKWYRRSAEEGLLEGKYSLGMMYARAKGVARNNKEAARYIFESLKGGDEYARRKARVSEAVWGREVRQELQRLLREEGVYSGPADGDFGRRTQEAIDKLTGRTS